MIRSCCPDLDLLLSFSSTKLWLPSTNNDSNIERASITVETVDDMVEKSVIDDAGALTNLFTNDDDDESRLVNASVSGKLTVTTMIVMKNCMIQTEPSNYNLWVGILNCDICDI